MLNIVCPCVGARQSPINTEPLGPNWAQKSQKDGKICIIRIDMVPSKYILPPYIVENTIPLLSSNEEQASELGQIRLPGVFGGPGADTKLLIFAHISGKPEI